MSRIRNVIALTLSFTSVAWGQTTGTKPASNTAKAPPTEAQGQVKTVDPNRKQALALLDQLLESALGFGDAEVRIRVQAQIADLLWESDQPRARALITAAFNAVPETELPPVDKEIPPSYIGADSHYPLRADLLRVIAQRDSALAVKLVETVVDQPPNVDPKFSGSGYGQYSEQAMLYGQIAGNVANSDPAVAGRIARTSIDKGDIELGLRVLGSLPPANADMARELFTQALAAAKRDREHAVSHMRSLADIVFPGFGEGVIRFTSGDRDPRSANPRNPELIQPFLEFAYEVIMENTRSTQASDLERIPPGRQPPTDFTVARLLMPYFEQHMPDKATILRPRVEEAVHVAVASARERGEIGRTAGLLTPREMVEAAETSVRPEQQEGTYFQAAIRAAQAGQIDQAKEIANKIINAQTRSAVEPTIRRMEDQKRDQAIRDAIGRGDFDNAYRIINELSELHRRIGALGNLAMALLTKKENARAVQVIAEAQRLTPNMENSIEAVYHQLRLAGIAARLDVDRGFEDLGQAVVSINRAQLAPRWTKIEKGPEGSWVRTDNGIGRLGFAFDAGFATFARIDFNRALQAARGIEMKEASVLAQLAICRGVLSPRR